MKKITLSCLTLAFALPAMAGTEMHGGDGVKIKGSIYLLDLVEAGADQMPYIDEKITISPDIAAAVEAKVPVDSIRLVERKLSEIARIDTVLAFSLARTIQLYEWRLVDSSLIQVNDENSPLNVDDIQLAIRQDHSIFINRDLFAQLDSANQAALILHEATFALSKSQVSSRAREINGGFFAADFAFMDAKRLREVVAGDLPTIGDYENTADPASLNLAFMAPDTFSAATASLNTGVYIFGMPSFAYSVDITTVKFGALLTDVQLRAQATAACATLAASEDPNGSLGFLVRADQIEIAFNRDTNAPRPEATASEYARATGSSGTIEIGYFTVNPTSAKKCPAETFDALKRQQAAVLKSFADRTLTIQ